MRLFISINLSDEVKQHLLSAMDALRMQGQGRFTPPENLHLTLAFLGETEQLDAAKEALSAIQTVPFPLTVEGIGTFDDLYWAGVRPSPALQSLQRELTHRLQDAGFSLEDREFVPHLTLVRRFTANGELDLSPVLRALGSSSCMIREVTLMESVQENGTHRYYIRHMKVLDEN